MGKPEGKRPLVRRIRRWANIKKDKRRGMGARTGLIWPKTGANARLLCAR